MVLKLYGLPLSGAAHRVAVVLHEKQVPFDYILIDFVNGEHKSAKYMEKQPFGLVPYIDDDGFILYESTQLIPSGTNNLAIFEQMASVEMANFDPAVVEVLLQRFYNRYVYKLPTDEKAYEKGLEKLNSTFAVYEKILSNQKYLVGNEITLVDLFHLPCLHLADKTNLLPLNGKPNVARWYKELSSRPSWEAVKESVIRNNVERFSTRGLRPPRPKI